MTSASLVLSQMNLTQARLACVQPNMTSAFLAFVQLNLTQASLVSVQPGLTQAFLTSYYSTVLHSFTHFPPLFLTFAQLARATFSFFLFFFLGDVSIMAIVRGLSQKLSQHGAPDCLPPPKQILLSKKHVKQIAKQMGPFEANLLGKLPFWGAKRA